MWDSFGFAQDNLRSFPAYIKASLRNQIGLFLSFGFNPSRVVPGEIATRVFIEKR